MNALAITSPSPVSRSQTDRLAREWIVKFAELYSVSLVERGPRFVELWVSAVADMEPNTFDSACRKAMQTCKFFPTPAEIRGQLHTAEAKGFELEAEGNWHKLLAWIHENYFPDVGIRRGAPSLSPTIEHAARAAGGFHYLESCSEEQLVWAKKSFVASMKNVHETNQSQHLIGNGEAKRILAQLAAGPPKPTQIASTLSHSQDFGSGIPNEEVDEVLSCVSGIPTRKEWQERKDSQKRALAQWEVTRAAEVKAEERA